MGWKVQWKEDPLEAAAPCLTLGDLALKKQQWNYTGDQRVAFQLVIIDGIIQRRSYQRVTCILRWATYKQNPSYHQCKHPFEFLIVNHSLDGSIHDYMFEESVCLLIRATWFIPLPVEAHEKRSTLCIGNQRWGDNGFVRGRRKESKPISREDYLDPDAGSSSGPKKKEAAQNTTGRRAKRALKREGADKAAASKHQQHLVRLGSQPKVVPATEKSET